MKITAQTTAAFLGLSLAAQAQAPKVNYTDHILPVFRNACTNCHNPDKKKAGLDLTTYQGTMAGGDSGASVKPGNPEGSLLYLVSTHAKEPTMPPKGDKLSEADLKLMKDWIAAFALETANSKPAVAQANKVEAAVVSLTRPDGPPPMPGDLPLDPFVKARALGALTTLAASPWAPLVAVGGQKQVFLYNVETLEPLGALAFPEGFPHVLRFSKNAKLLLAGGGLGGKSGRVVLWDVTTGDRVGAVGNEADAVLAADLSADQQFVALGGPDKRVKIYQTKDGKQTGLIKKHTEWITAVAYSPDGKYLGTADRNGGIEIWESGPEPKPFNSLAGHKSSVTSLAFMPGVLASGSEDGTIKLWNVKEGNETRSWNAHGGGVLWVEFTPDGRLVSCGRDKVAKVWDATGKVLATTEAFNDIATRAVMQGERVVAADWTGEIRVFALAGDKVNRVGELSANPPGIAEQLSAAEKTLAETTAALPALQKALADAEARVKAEAEAAEAKRKQDLAAAEARKAEAQKQLDEAKAAPAIAEKALNDANARVAAAKEAVAKAQQQVETAKQAMNSAGQERGKAQQALKTAQQRLADLEAEIAKRREARSKFAEGTPEYAKADEAVQSIKPELAKAAEAAAAAQAKLDSTPADGAQEVDTAKAALADAQKKADAARQEQQKAQQELVKIKNEAPKRADEAMKALAAAGAEVEKYQKPAARQPSPAAAAKVAELSKKLEDLNAQIEKRRAERAKVNEGAPEYAKLNERVQALKPEIDKVAAELEAAKAAAAQPGPTEGEAALAKAKAELDAANQRIESAKAGVDRWRRAQLFQNVFNARASVAALQSRYDDLVATAKDAFRPVEMSKQAIIDAEKTIADAPKVIAEKEAAFAAAKKAADDAKAAVTAAEKAIEAKKSEQPDKTKIEAEIAEAKKQLEAHMAEVNKAREARDKAAEGSPERAAAAARRDALRPKQTELEGRVAALQKQLESKPGETPIPPEMIEAVKKAQLEAKLAAGKVPPVEKALADAKQAVEDAKKQIPELQARIPQLEAEGAKTKAEAEKNAAIVAKELQAAKAELEKLRAQYEAAKGTPAGATTASTSQK